MRRWDPGVYGSALLVGTNLVGAGVAVVLSTLVIPSPPPERDTLLALTIGVPGYVAVAIAIGAG